MRYCVPIPCFFGNEDFSEAIRKVAALGFDAVETYNWKSIDLDKARATAEECGVEIMSMCTTEFRMTSPEHRSLWLAGLEESCIAANRIGASRLITQVGQDTGAPRSEQRAAIVDTLKLARPILEKYSVTVMIEPLNTFVDHKGYYLHSAYEAFDIIAEVNHPLVKVVYDIYHQQIMEGNIIPSITGNLDKIAHLHCAGHPGRGEPWLGESNYDFIFAAVDKAGYTGACGLEYFPKTMSAVESLIECRKRYK